VHTIDESKLNESIQQLFVNIIEKQDTVSRKLSEISFLSGYIWEQEGYKREIISSASSVLDNSNWTEDMIGTGKICKHVLKMYDYKTSMDGKPQNLVDWRDIDEIKDVFLNNPNESERALFELFVRNNEEAAFHMLVELVGRRFPLISYLYFLKDSKRFAPVRPDSFCGRFQRVGIETDCLRRCTWDNMLEFNNILEHVRNKIQEYFKEDIELIDAHSFVWMMWHIEDEKPQDEFLIPLDERELESVVIEKQSEGFRKRYYTTRYERSAKNRNNAIRIHGLKCMVCDFDFEETYGELGKGFIEVHHVMPLSDRNEVVDIAPETDLVCLCPNCHRMIHRKKNYVMSVDELKGLLKKR
jgi:hypothetical protein